MAKEIKDAIHVKNDTKECPYCGYRQKAIAAYTYIITCCNENCGRKIRIRKKK